MHVDVGERLLDLAVLLVARPRAPDGAVRCTEVPRGKDAPTRPWNVERIVVVLFVAVSGALTSERGFAMSRVLLYGNVRNTQAGMKIPLKNS